MHTQKNRGTLDIMYEEVMIKALYKTRGAKNKTAALLGVSERTLYSMIRRYSFVEPNPYPKPIKKNNETKTT